MFTGLIGDVGKVQSVTNTSEGKRLFIKSEKFSPVLKVGDSIAINGACQTVLKIEGSIFSVDSVWVTLEKTNLGKLGAGSIVNLELPLLANSRLDGHFVSGHVNAVAKIKKLAKQGENTLLTIAPPLEQMRYFSNEGSVAIDGISLTIAEVDDGEGTFTCSIIPHTVISTTLANRSIGDDVNIEVDILAKYMERLLTAPKAKKNITEKWLLENGY
jgi:riboflavin synthase